jgi:hypothetical protein
MNNYNFESRFFGFVFIAFLLSICILASQNLDKHQLKNIKNPVIDEPGMSDPHVLVIKKTCYLFTGHDIGIGVPDWIMPDWRIYKSTDLKSWKHVGTISPADNLMGKGNTNCWAGDIVARNGKYYWYYSNRKIGTGVMVAKKPEGPYKEALGKYIVDSFDPTIFVDDDNKPYIIYGEHTYKIARLKDSMIELDEEPNVIVINKTKFFPSADKNSLHKHNGVYYLCTSGYYATSKNIYGPYETQGLVGKGYGIETGYAHGEFFVWKGDWYHTWCRYQNRSIDRMRDCFIAPTYFDENGNMYDDLRNINEKYKGPGTH